MNSIRQKLLDKPRWQILKQVSLAIWWTSLFGKALLAKPCWQILFGKCSLANFGKASLAKPRGQILPDNFGGQASLVKLYGQNLGGKSSLARSHWQLW